MTPFVADPDFTLWHGDALEVLAGLAPDSIDCALCSPPFYGLRDYGVDGQIGLEATPDEWVARLVAVFAEVRRVLSPTGTLWVEIGDSYAGSRAGPQGATGQMADRGVAAARARTRDADLNTPGMKPKDLLGQPWLLAFALRTDGWWLRQAIVWHKPNAMPESATDRCTTAHSYVFLLSKSARYHFDSEAIAEPAEWARWGDQTTPKHEGTATGSGWMQPKSKDELRLAHRRAVVAEGGVLFTQVEGCPLHDLTYFHGDQTRHEGVEYPACHDCVAEGKSELVARGGRTTNGANGRTEEKRGFDNRLDRADGLKNPRSVWTIPTQGFPGAHFATWPEQLVERIIRAGCREGGTVLDPFMGSGTTALVARRLGRKAVGIELNADYCRMAAARLGQQSLLAERVPA